MVFKLLDNVIFSPTGDPGTSDITVGSAADGWETPADAGLADGDVSVFKAEEGDAWETFYGVYTATGTKLARTRIDSSSGSAIDLTSAAVVRGVGLAGALFGTVGLAPAQITGDQNDYNPTGFDRANVVHLTSDAARTITGLVAPSPERPALKLLVNDNASDAITISHESSSSTEANRITGLAAADLVLAAGSWALIAYSSAANRWQVLLASAGQFRTNAAAKTTPVDADSLPLVDSADSNKPKLLSWQNLKTTLQSLFTSASAVIGDGHMVVGDGGGRGVKAHASGAPGTAAFKDTGTSGGTVPLLNGANQWSAGNSFVTAIDFGQTLTARNTVDSANQGPAVIVDRQSAGPAANDRIGLFSFFGRNSAAESVRYAALEAQILDPTDGEEDGVLHYSTITAGSVVFSVSVAQGMYLLGATGGDQGQGTINATKVFDDGVDVTCMALQFLETGKFDDADVAEWDAKVPDLVEPERIEERPVTEMREVEESFAKRDAADGSIVHYKLRRTKPVQKTERVLVYDDKGNGLDVIEDAPVFETVTIPEKRTKRRHEGAHRFKAMLDDGFDPRNPVAYLAKMKKDRALPGMPTEGEWMDRQARCIAGEKGQKISVGEMHNRMWLALEFLALGFDNHETRLTTLESAAGKRSANIL